MDPTTSSLFPTSFAQNNFTTPSPIPSLPDTSIYYLLHTSPTTNTKAPRILLLLHGYPQNHTLWHTVIAEFAKTDVLSNWTVIIPDLPGYGLSTKSPSPDNSHLHNSKRSVSTDLVALIDSLFPASEHGGKPVQFAVAGHDRGARVGYRMARDHGDRVVGFNAQDIVPTQVVFDKMTHPVTPTSETFRSYHWIFLALPSPLPETLISANPSYYITHTLHSWTGTRFLSGGTSKFHPVAFSSWVTQYSDPSVVIGSLEDYRAGVSIDLEHDGEDEGVLGEGVNVLVLYSVHLAKRFEVGKVWEGLAKRLRELRVGDDETGHFLPVEATEQVAGEMVRWLGELEWRA